VTSLRFSFRSVSQNIISPPEGNGWIQINNVLSVHWYDGEQLPTDIYRALNENTQPVLSEEGEYEEVSYGETRYGPDEYDYDGDI
jgi:hypothetical protein